MTPEYTSGAEVFACPWRKVGDCTACDDYLLEAWERQTNSGCIVSTHHMRTSIDRYLSGIEVYRVEMFGVYPYRDGRP